MASTCPYQYTGAGGGPLLQAESRRTANPSRSASEVGVMGNQAVVGAPGTRRSSAWKINPPGTPKVRGQPKSGGQATFPDPVPQAQRAGLAVALVRGRRGSICWLAQLPRTQS